MSVSCNKELATDQQPISNPLVVTCDVTEVSAMSAVIPGKIIYDGVLSSDAEVGIAVSGYPSMRPIKSYKLPAEIGDDYSFSVISESFFPEPGVLFRFEQGTTYYYRAYLSLDGVDTYGEIKSFNLIDEWVETLPPKDVTSNSAVLRAKLNLAPRDFKHIITWGFDLSDGSVTVRDTYPEGGIMSETVSLKPGKRYKYRPYVLPGPRGTCPGEVVEFNTLNGDSTPELIQAIDLGLSVEWASLNLGAISPEDYGYYYAWGETDFKVDYTDGTYKWCDNDAAQVILGEGWRMPTIEEIDELIHSCTCVWSSMNNVNGYTITGPNGNSIFLPATGYLKNTYALEPHLIYGSVCADYWSSDKSQDVQNAKCLHFDSTEIRIWPQDIWVGCPIRPVRPVAAK